jgi:hypothetical protein
MRTARSGVFGWLAITTIMRCIYTLVKASDVTGAMQGAAPDKWGGSQ